MYPAFNTVWDVVWWLYAVFVSVVSIKLVVEHGLEEDKGV